MEHLANPRLRTIKKKLIQDAEKAMRTPSKLSPDSVLGGLLSSDLKHHPHAFVVGCLMDYQMPAKRAWAIPDELKKRIGHFDIARLAKLPESKVIGYMLNPTPLHRFKETAAKNLYSTIQRILHKYKGDASLIWKRRPSSLTVVRRFLEFEGIGPKIASMAVNILTRHYRIPLSDYRAVDISVDVHIKPVFARLGFVPSDAKTELIVATARELNPDYPGIFDHALWVLGRDVCRPRNPQCHECKFRLHCLQVPTRAP